MIKHASRPLLLCTVATLSFLGLVLFAAAGLRGSDQYWYTAEVERILAGAINQGTVAFPYHAHHQLLPPPFNHHTLVHYAVAAVALFTGPYYGWIVVNTLATLLTAFLVYQLVKRSSGSLPAAYAYTLMLLLPLPFWVTAQPYLESALAPFIAGGLLLYVAGRNAASTWIGLFLLFAAAYMCRSAFIAVLFLVPLGCLYHLRDRGKGAVLLAALLGLGGIAAVKAYRLMFAPDPALTFRRYLNAKVPGVSGNMDVLYALQDEPIELWKLLRKAQAGVVEQVLVEPLSANLFYLPFNLALLLTLWLLLRRRREVSTRLVVGLLVCIGLHGATIVLRGNEFRFLHVVQPAVVAGAAIALAQLLRDRAWTFLSAATLAALVISSSYLAFSLRSEAKEQKQVQVAVGEIFDQLVPKDHAIMLGTPGFAERDLLFGYIVRPRLVLFMRSEYGYTTEQIEVMRSNANAKWLFAKRNSPLVDELAQKPWELVTDSFPKPFAAYGLYRLPS
ncbi:MAG: hypothetical protein KDD69_03170 [Bdellovibrionales bacterium]|nr:hypothetical protein [Bdellovibrionales bacterium]